MAPWPVPDGITVRGALAAARRRLRSSPSAQLDAEVLLATSLQARRETLHARPEALLSTHQARRFSDLVARRGDGEPVAYLTGQREFWSASFLVTRATLIPRPDTETLVAQALAQLPGSRPWTVAELGTGCGAVALSIAAERPACTVVATDLSAPALSVARANAARLGIHNVRFVHGHWLAALAARSVEMVLANPPYVRDGDPHLLSGDVAFEPRGALAAGTDGLDALREIITGAGRVLRPHGHLLLEHGDEQADAVAALMEEAGFHARYCHADLAGRPRVTAARRNR